MGRIRSAVWASDDDWRDLMRPMQAHGHAEGYIGGFGRAMAAQMTPVESGS